MGERINERYIADFFGMDPTDNADDISIIRSGLKKMYFSNNNDICTIDTESDGMFFIESGTVIVLDEEEKQLNILHAGQYFGEYGVLSGQKRLSTVRSMGRSVVYKMESKDLMDFLGKHPDIYGEFMKRVYAQLSGKHSQILALSGMRKGILSYPANNNPMSFSKMLIQYGIVFLIYMLALLGGASSLPFPLFLLPLIFMLCYVLITKRTVESLITSGILAAILVYRSGVFTGYVDSIMMTMSQPDNVFTVLVMALIGGMVNLIVVSGGVTAFEKTAVKYSKTEKNMFFSSLIIMLITAIDDGLNMLTATYSAYKPAKENKTTREKQALFFSMLPTVLSSFFPISLWGIFVTGTLAASVKKDAALLFIRSVPYNFFSIITLIAMILFALGHLPYNMQLKEAEKRKDETGVLWPKGSEKYLSVHDSEVWGRKLNVILPIIVMAVSSVIVRSIISKSLVTDSAIGLAVTLTFMFFLYCFQKIMTPEQFIEHLIDGIADSTLPIILYLLTINFSTLLDSLGLHIYLEQMIDVFEGRIFLLPCMTFLLSMAVTMALGSSWSMYAIIFPIVIGLSGHLGIDPALMTGAVAGAGIAGEKNCAFTSEAFNIGNAVGINPDAAKRVRISYSVIFTAITAFAYLLVGLISQLLLK
ncbi:MAG: cyclic nucleotide-binding domain-containing protein [Lachnospiraceae bacterium]|nr:cyclic nucleotide-binding domain-containing protein [Lachnospiraceae bacterium]